jgi:ribosomal protein S18 acetylase RimI-like enzyme
VTWNIRRENSVDLDLREVLEVYRSSGLGERRPMADTERMAAMVRNANLILSCRIDGELVGIARSISDFSYVTFLSDIAVSGAYQRSGIGRALIEATQKEAPQAKVVLLSAPAATGFYPRIGFVQHNSAWVLSP